MKNKNPMMGSIIRIPLELNLGYVFAKIVDLGDLLNKDLSVNYLLYIYDYVVQNTKEFDIKNMENRDLLVGPLFILDLIPAIKNGKFNIIYKAELKEHEMIIPDFKVPWPLIVTYEDEATEWRYIRNLDINTKIVSTLEKVKHLEIFGYLSNDMVSRRITMEYLRQTKKNIEDFYQLKEWKEISIYKNVVNTPVYKSIPKDIRGKAIG